MSSYHLTHRVPDDLAEVWQHIAEDDPEAADRVNNAIFEAFEKIAEWPGMGHRRPDLNDDSLRVWPVFSYLIIYRFKAEPVEIVRVVSGYRDMAALLMQ